MLCKHCGSPIQENEKFCTVCGNKLDYDTEYAQNFAPTEIIMPDTFNQVDNNNYNQSNIAENVEKTNKKKKLKKGKNIFIIILVLTLSLAVALTAVFFTSPAYSVYKQMDENEISSALSEYRVDVKDNFLQEKILSTLLKDSVEQVATEYTNGSIGYSAATEELKALEEMKIENAYAKRTAIMTSYANETFSKYNNGEIIYEDASDIMKTLSEDGYVEANALLENITASHNADETMQKADEFFNKKDYENAISEYSKIPKENKNYNDAQNKLNETYTAYTNHIIKTAEKYNTSNEPTKSITLIEKAYSVLPETANLTELKKKEEESLNLYKTDITNSVDEFVEEEKWTEAFALIDEAIAFENNEYFTTLKTTTENKYVEAISTKVYTYMDAEDFVSAKRVAEHALTILPGNSDLKALKKEVEDKTPIYLLDVCAPYSTEGYDTYVSGETFKSGGTTYTNGFSLAYIGSAIFNLNSSYNTLNFTIGHIDTSDKMPTTIKIYCDDILEEEIYITADELPKKVSIDITGVKQLKFTAEQDTCGHMMYFGGVYYGFGNVTVK